MKLRYAGVGCFSIGLLALAVHFFELPEYNYKWLWITAVTLMAIGAPIVIHSIKVK
jgi:hypothetical protein